MQQWGIGGEEQKNENVWEKRTTRNDRGPEFGTQVQYRMFLIESSVTRLIVVITPRKKNEVNEVDDDDDENDKKRRTS